MTTRSALEVASEYSAALAVGDAERMKSLRSEGFVLDFVHTDASAGGPLSAHDTESFWPAWFAAFPERDYEVTRTIVADEVVVTQWVFIGTHAEPLGPPVSNEAIEPSGRTIRFRGASFYDISDGLIQRETLYIDLATVMVELGVEP